ncbi:Leucine-rich repeat-containing protein [Cynara cardunculus var. scolymus]|uniref:non-specific serine/threonine protein kinase n=1 Tax=Cynara cardunculus var. scolymus TaxID=59895 RepID=A0A103YIT6_CYNCS|nr:Leucine-rich repeat-containing protein [Cynara cardunculus var. scolymus]
MFMANLSLFFHAIVLLSWPATLAIASLAGNNTDHLALLAIKSSITHDPQGVLNTWNTSIHFCQWQGVTCGRRHPRVTILNLGSRGIVGSLSPQIGNLSFLRVIRLGNNTFNGVIPPQVGGLFRLQKLILYNNSFEGEIPASLSNCTRLNILGLGGNQLVGKLPQQLGSLLNLVILSINDNSFSGGTSFMGNLTSLEVLAAHNNHLGGNIPDVFGQLHSLKDFVFAGNRLHGTIPPSLYNLTSLRTVDLYENQISGGLSKDIGLQLPNLEELQIWRNKLTGSIPSSISNCSNLVHLDLAENGFTGKVDINFRHIPNLRFLVLYQNSLGSSEPDEMNFIDSMINCSNLELFLAFKNQLRGVLPSSLANLSSQLTLLDLGANFIYGSLPSGIGNLVKLETISMQYNQLTGIIPSELGNLGNLTQLYLNNNKFTGNFPDSISSLSLLLELDLSVNRLEGQMPQNLGNCKSLVKLYLPVNNLTGPIPRELFQLSSLIYLDLSQNHLVGPLPQDIGNLKSLTVLNLSKNDLVGEIPDAITSCTSLEYVYLEANSFAGPIAPAFRALRGIRDLDLSSNNFSGKIPIFLEQLNLSSLNLSFNNLDGKVPTGGIFKNASMIAINGNGRLCGGIPELGLPRCDLVARSKKGSRVILVVVPLFSFLVLAMALSLLFCWQRRKRQTQPPEASAGQPFSRVSYGSILKATDEFSEQNLIGTGTFSAVYKGILEAGGAMVAIKVLKLGNQGALKSFMAECEALKNIRHRNLVKIITSCSSIDFQGNDFKALIYEFMPNGNLDTWLHPSQEQEIETEEAAPRRLSLHQRVTIALDVAHAIHYLHQECEIPIIHCDLKPSNILLDNDMVAHIGDFGLAKFLPLKPHESSSIGIRGTVGYAAPEYGLGSKMTKEGDIYSFGILLLEMMTGKRPTDEVFKEGLNLYDCVKMALPDRVMEIVEPTVKEEMEAASVNRRSGEDEVRRWKRLEEGIMSLARIGKLH